MNTHREPTSDFVIVNGVRLQMLDWGGTGRALVFLGGYANTPHFFDRVARAFTDRFRVLGLSRRGHGESGQPEDGYDIATLGNDVIGFLDAMGLDKASLAGHSFAGHELCYLAAAHADRIEKLVFLDALYSYTEADIALFAENPVPAFDPPPDDFPSVEAYCEDFVTRYPAYRPLRSPRWDALWAHALVETPEGRFREKIRPETAARLSEGMGAFEPDYAAIACPTLAFFAFQNENWLLPEGASDELRQAMKVHADKLNAQFKRRCVERVRREIADVRIVEYADTSHYCFLDREADVIDEMQRFL
ncbi:alpha/beta hydrolase [Candidatus Bipolaricaulota bacterium]|nr:alpha/beta hydrolase [Candidatus Bipolaricaulota bacterium]